MYTDVAAVVAATTFVGALVALHSGAVLVVIAGVGVATWAFGRAMTTERETIAPATAEPAATGAAGPEEQAAPGACSVCGRTVAAEEDRCDDCSVVGSWRK